MNNYVTCIVYSPLSLMPVDKSHPDRLPCWFLNTVILLKKFVLRWEEQLDFPIVNRIAILIKKNT